MSNLRVFVEHIFDQLGYHITANWRVFSDPQERYMRRLFELLRPDLVFDVGANAGQFAMFLRDRCGYRGHIVSYEPIPEVAEQCRRSAAGDNRWRVEAQALGAARGEMAFNVMSSDRFSSFLPPARDQPREFEASNHVTRTINVPVSTLDEVFPGVVTATRARRPYLKLDTQGYDLEVLAGGRSSMTHFVALQTEIAVTRLYDGAPSVDETVKTLRALGFEPSAFFPTNDHFPRLIDMDCYFVRRTTTGAKFGEATTAAH